MVSAFLLEAMERVITRLNQILNGAEVTGITLYSASGLAANILPPR